MYGNTTCFAAISSDDPILTGEEVFNIYGPKFQENMDGSLAEQVKLIHENKQVLIRSMKGLKRRWNCLEKAILVRLFINAGSVAIGRCVVWNNERDGTFGYYYNPPFEFHAWVELEKKKFIVDFGLPGVIEKGLNTADQYGYILKDIEPVILCGPVPEWLDYEAGEYLSEAYLKSVAANYSIDKILNCV